MQDLLLATKCKVFIVPISTYFMELWALAKVANRTSNGKTRLSCTLASIMICKLWWRTRLRVQTQTKERRASGMLFGVLSKACHVVAFPLHGATFISSTCAPAQWFVKASVLIASDIALLSIIYKELALLSLCFFRRQGGQPYQHLDPDVTIVRITLE